MSLWLPLLLACTQAPIYGPAYGDTGGEGSDTAGDEPDGAPPPATMRRTLPLMPLCTLTPWQRRKLLHGT